MSRLGGSSFVMDDGDDKFLRKKKAHEGPPEYAAVELGETDGIKTILHNELIRLRTRTGHQILMHNSEDLIYISNSRGTAWIELTSDGKMEVYAEDSISFRTKQDFNFYADRDINMEAGRNFNTKVKGEKHTHVMGDQILIVDGNQKIQIKQDVDKTYEKNYKHHVKLQVDKLYEKDFLHTVYNSVIENFVTQSGTVKTTTGGNTDVIINGNIKITHNGSFDHTVTGDRKITTGGTHHIKTTGQHRETASEIHMNSGSAAASPAAAAAGGADAAEAGLPKRLKLHTIVDLTSQDEWQSLISTESIVRRMPTPEPYPHHENLDPLNYKPGKLDRDKDGRYESTDGEELTDQSDFTSDMNEPAGAWRTYSTSTDTFAKVPAPNQQPEEE